MCDIIINLVYNWLIEINSISNHVHTFLIFFGCDHYFCFDLDCLFFNFIFSAKSHFCSNLSVFYFFLLICNILLLLKFHYIIQSLPTQAHTPHPHFIHNIQTIYFITNKMKRFLDLLSFLLSIYVVVVDIVIIVASLGLLKNKINRTRSKQKKKLISYQRLNIHHIHFFL